MRQQSQIGVTAIHEIDIQAVDVLFGGDRTVALRPLDEGQSRDAVRAATGSVAAVANATLEFEDGEISVLMGLSGSGKSTLFRAINALNMVARSQILMRDGTAEVDIAHCDPATLRALRSKWISMVLRQFAPFPWRSIHELSSGMQQRMGLAQALATDADILLMAGPFSALDPLIRDHLQDDLPYMQKRLRKTIHFACHDLDEALKIGNRIAIMEAGRIVQFGEPETIALKPASPCVAEFVAQVNAMSVLRGRSLMTPVQGLAQDGEDPVPDCSDHNRLRLNGDGSVASASIGARRIRSTAYRNGDDLSPLTARALAAASTDVACGPRSRSVTGPMHP